jgi:anthranilate synthase component II
MRALLVENEDSFSWNVVDRLPLDRRDVEVVRGADALARPELLATAGVVIIGPGPTDPERAGLVEIVRRAADLGRPILGICLGHQAIGLAFGARLARVAPAHGKRVVVTFHPSRLFASLRGPVEAMRYNSLGLVDVPPPLHVIAEAETGAVMGVEHASLPIAGLQFHPDSYGTPRGEEMIRAFFEAIA